MKLEPRPAIDMEKLHLTAVSWVDGASGEYQGRAKSLSQVDGVSDMTPICWLCGSLLLFLWEKAVPQLSP